MKLILEIGNKAEAKEALNILNAYVGNVTELEVAKVVAPVVVEQEVVAEEKPVKVKKEKAVKVETSEVVKEDTDEQEVAPKAEAKSDGFERKEKSEGITLAELKELGVKVRNAVGVVKTKEIISKYALTLSEVAESDYDSLASDLKASL